MRGLTQIEASKRFTKNGVELLGIYVNVSTPVASRCLKCGHEWMAYPSNIFQNHVCLKCSGKMQLSSLEVSDRLLSRGIELISNYVNARTPIEVRCLECKFKWKRTIPGGEGHIAGCPKCVGGIRLTQQEAFRRFSSKNIKMIGEYKNNLTKVLSLCLACNYEWEVIPGCVFYNSGCPNCAGNIQLTHDEVSGRFHKRNLQLLESYISSGVSALTLCNKCGHKWKVKPSQIFSGHGCPQCAPSGFQSDKPAILYYVRINVIPPVYKIGISNNTVSRRFGPNIRKITVIDVKHFKNGADAFSEEQELLRKYAECRYRGPTLLSKFSTKEMFDRDVLGLEGIRQKEFQFA